MNFSKDIRFLKKADLMEGLPNEYRELYEQDKSPPRKEFDAYIVRKALTYEEAKSDATGSRPHRVIVTYRRVIEPSQWDMIARSLLKDRPELFREFNEFGHQGIMGVMELTDGKRSMYVDTQGYDYARYIAIPVEEV